MFEVKKRGNKNAAAGLYSLALLFFVIWYYIYFYGPEGARGQICSSTSMLLLSLAGIFALTALGISVPVSVRISDETLMVFRGTSLAGEARLDRIEVVKILHPEGVKEVEVVVGGDTAVKISETDIGADRLQAIIEEMKKASEKHHFQVVEKERYTQRKKESAGERMRDYIDAQEEREQSLIESSDSEDTLPYEVK